MITAALAFFFLGVICLFYFVYGSEKKRWLHLVIPLSGVASLFVFLYLMLQVDFGGK